MLEQHLQTPHIQAETLTSVTTKQIYPEKIQTTEVIVNSIQECHYEDSQGCASLWTSQKPKLSHETALEND